MKKLILLVGLILVLSACGDDTTTEPDESFDGSQAQGTEETEEEVATTDDPLEFVYKTTDDMILMDGFNEYVIKDYYVNDETDEQGFNTYEEDGFTLRYALVETENIADVEVKGEREVQILGEIVNDTDVDYNFYEGMLIKTDDKEVSEVQFGLNGAGAADQKSKFIDSFPLEYDIPEGFTFTILDPLYDDDDEANWNEDGTMKDPDVVAELEFHKE